MKMPRDISGMELIGALRSFGYTITRQSGSHIRITTDRDGLHRETIPNHSLLKVGTLRSILRSIADHHKLDLDDLLRVLDL